MIAQKLRLYHRVQLAAHRLRKVADRTVSEATGISTAQSAVLGIVAAGNRVTQRDVATALGLNDSALTAMTGRLMKLGLIDRVRSESDARAWTLSVTEDGLAAQRAARAAFAAINKRIEGALSRLASMQASNGHFSMWGDDDYVNPALTPYIVEFLLDAREAGFQVPENLLQKSLQRLNEDLLAGDERRSLVDQDCGALVRSRDDVDIPIAVDVTDREVADCLGR